MITAPVIRYRDPADITGLYVHYPRELSAQPCFLALDLEGGELWTDYNAEIGSGVPESVWAGRTLRWDIPPLTAAGANRLLDEAADAAGRVLAGSSVEWDGQNHRGVLDSRAQAAADTIEGLCEARRAEAEGDPEVVVECDAADWFQYDTREQVAAQYGITADSTDDTLAGAAAQAQAEALPSGSPGPLVLDGAAAYFADLRDYLRAAVREQ